MQETNPSTKQSAEQASYYYANTYPAPNSQPESSGISVLWYYLGLIRRRFWIILPFVLIFLAAGIIKAAKAPRIYSSRAKVIVERSQPSIMSFDRSSGYSGYDPAFSKTQPEIIKSRVVMEMALENPAIKQLFNVEKSDKADRAASSLASDIKKTLLAALGGDPAPAPAPWERLSARITATPEQESSVIAISVKSGVPEETALIANATAEAFKEYQIRMRLSVLSEAAGTLITEKDKEEQAFIEAEKALQTFYEQSKGFSGEGSQTENNKLASINSKITAIQLNRIRLNAEMDIMRQITSTNDAVSAYASRRIFSIPAVSSSPIMTSAKANLAEAQKDLSDQSTTYGKDHPVIKDIESKIEFFENQFLEGLNDLILSQQQNLEILDKEERELTSQYDAQKDVLLRISEETFTLQRLKDSMNRHRALYDSLADRTAQIKISTSLATTNVQIIEKAAIPTNYLPLRQQHTIILYLLIGMTIGGGLAFLLESLDKTIKTPEDLLAAMDVPLLGFIPAIDETYGESEADAGLKLKMRKAIKDLQRKALSMMKYNHSQRQGKHISIDIWKGIYEMFSKLGALTGSEYIPTSTHYRQRNKDKQDVYIPSLVLTDASSSITEAYRHIRTNLLFSNVDKSRKVLTITSCGPKEGKTTTASNLALSIALSGKRVLLIDADLHRPKIHALLNMKKTETSAGLTSVLIGETTWRHAIEKASYDGHIIKNLDVMLSGPSTPYPAELLGSETMKGVLNEARSEYDWILIDTPPILFVSDALVMSSFSDGTIIVVKAGTNTKGLLDRTKSQLDNIQANIIGSVLNNMILSSLGRYYSYYGCHGYSSYSKDYHKTYYGEGDGEQ